MGLCWCGFAVAIDLRVGWLILCWCDFAGDWLVLGFVTVLVLWLFVA